MWCVMKTSSNIIFEILNRPDHVKHSCLSRTNDKWLNLYCQDEIYNSEKGPQEDNLILSACNTDELIDMIDYNCIEFVPVDEGKSISITVPLNRHDLLREWIFHPSNTSGINNININIISSNIILRGLVPDNLDLYRQERVKIYSNWNEIHFLSFRGYSFTELGQRLHIDRLTQSHSGFYVYVVEDLMLRALTQHVLKLDVRMISN